MQKWEYHKYYSEALPAADELNDWGEDGWELVGIYEGTTRDFKGFISYFKRPKA